MGLTSAVNKEPGITISPAVVALNPLIDWIYSGNIVAVAMVTQNKIIMEITAILSSLFLKTTNCKKGSGNFCCLAINKTSAIKPTAIGIKILATEISCPPKCPSPIIMPINPIEHSIKEGMSNLLICVSVISLTTIKPMTSTTKDAVKAPQKIIRQP